MCIKPGPRYVSGRAEDVDYAEEEKKRKGDESSENFSANDS